MHSRKLLDLLFVGLSAIAVTEATFIDVRLAAQNGAAIQRRQNDGDDPGAATTSVPTSSPPATTSPPRTTTSPSRTTSLPTTPPSSSPPRTTASSPTTPPPTSEPPKTTEPPKSDPSSSDIVETITQVITGTNDDGSPTVLTTRLTTTQPPGLANNGGSQPSGMSTQTRNTVIGVVVGVGGAIVLGGLAFVAWRIWGRKKGPEENDGLMDYGSTAEKPESGGSMSGRTPFQSTLESYHAPTQVNTASNF